MEHYDNAADSASGLSLSESWLFVQSLLGNPIPDPTATANRARAEREHLEWLAQISDEHEAKLRSILREETEARELLRRRERFSEDWTAQEQWDPSKHPRQGGPPNAGWFASTGGGGGSSGGLKRSGVSDGSNERDRRAPPQDMLDLAHAWWQTNEALQQARRDIANLPERVANERAQVGSGGRYAYIHTQNLTNAERDLETARQLVPQLEKQLGDLHQQYRDSGYDDIDYTKMNPGEHFVGGKGIENVGRAVAKRGSPAGPRPTGVEFDVALAAPAALQLGKAVLGRALNSIPRSSRVGSLTELPTPPKAPVEGRGGPYGHMVDPPSANSGLDFTRAQKRNILKENAHRNDGVMRDDRTGQVLVPAQQRRRGVPAPPNEAQVDHVYPKAKGGPNTYSNAEVRSRINNVRKGNKLE